MTRCKACGKETYASLCNVCFLEELLGAVEDGETDPSKILKRMTVKFGRLKGLRNLPVFKKVFGHPQIRRVITHAETGERCKLVPSYDGWVAVTSGSRKPVFEESLEELEEPPSVTAEGSRIEPLRGRLKTFEGQSAEGGRIITYYEGDTPILEQHLPTSLVFPRYHPPKRARYITSGPPSRHYKSPLAHKRPPSTLD